MAAFLSVHATTKAQKVTLAGKDLSLKEVFTVIEKQTGYVVFYNRAMLADAKKVSLSVKDRPVQEVLNIILKDQQLDFVIQDKTISISRKALVKMDDELILLQNPINIHVTDSAGGSLPGASILVKNTMLSGVTDANGSFTAALKEGDVIVVSFIGHETRTVTVTKAMLRSGTLNVVMQVSITRLVDVEVIVNTGYQKLSQERATGSFSKPDMKVFANRTGTMDVIGRLQGQIAGMTIAPSGANISDNSTVTNSVTGTQTRKALVRGASTVQLSTEPLYVVNGIAVQDFSAVNVDDIADITVLKDAAASAIWGSKAANGVVVITTKSAAKNQRLQITYNGFIDWQGKPDFNYVRKRFLSSKQYIDVSRQLFDPADYPYSQYNSWYNYIGLTPSQQVLYDQDRGLLSAGRANAMLDSMAGIDNTSQVEDLLFTNAFTTNHTVSISGGTNNYNVFASLGYMNAQTYTPGEKNTSYKINLTQSFTPNDRFSFSLNALLADNISTSRGSTTAAGDVLPYQLIRDAKGNDINMPFMSAFTPEVIQQYGAASGIDLNTYKPLQENRYSTTKTDLYTINLVGNAKVKLWRGLSFQGTYGYESSPTSIQNLYDNRNYAYRKQIVDNTLPGDPPTYLIPVEGFFYRPSNNKQRTWTVRNQLVYNYSGREGNDLLSLQAGQEANEVYTLHNGSVIYGYNPQLETYPLLDYYTLSQGVPGTVGGYGGGLQQPTEIDEKLTRYSSYFALASYTLNHKYSIDGSWRVDHSNLFGSDVSSQNKPAYSVGGKWNIQREHFMEDIKWLNGLALRATYGIAGNSPYVGQQATVFDVLYVEANPNYQYPVVGGTGFQLSSPANKKLSWEATHTINLGVDFSTFNSRLGGTVEYYHKKTTDMLGQAPVNYFTGFLTTLSNIGNLANKGLNISLNSRNIITHNFTWESGLVFGYNQNKLISYEIPQSYQNYPGSRTGQSPVLGYPLNSVFAYRYAGLNAQGDPQIRLAKGTVTSDPNGATVDDLPYMGTTVPKFNGGLTNYFSYKQFGLSLNMIYSFGAVMRTDANKLSNADLFFSGVMPGRAYNLNDNLSVDFLKRWQKPGDEKITNIPRYIPVEDYNLRNMDYFRYADINVASASYIKLNEATFTYALSPGALRLLKIESAIFRFQINNIMLWKANKLGINPEFQSSVFGTRFMPVGQHSITLGTTINF